MMTTRHNIKFTYEIFRKAVNRFQKQVKGKLHINCQHTIARSLPTSSSEEFISKHI